METPTRGSIHLFKANHPATIAINSHRSICFSPILACPGAFTTGAPHGGLAFNPTELGVSEGGAGESSLQKVSTGMPSKCYYRAAAAVLAGPRSNLKLLPKGLVRRRSSQSGSSYSESLRVPALPIPTRSDSHLRTDGVFQGASPM